MLVVHHNYVLKMQFLKKIYILQYNNGLQYNNAKIFCKYNYFGIFYGKFTFRTIQHIAFYQNTAYIRIKTNNRLKIKTYRK